MCLFLSHTIMYDSDSSEFELMRLKMYHFFNFLALVPCILNQGKSREFKWKFQGNLGLIIDLCREFLTLESGNTGFRVESCFIVPGAMPLIAKKNRQKQLEQSLEKAREAKESKLLVRGHLITLILECKVALNPEKAISPDFCQCLTMH